MEWVVVLVAGFGEGQIHFVAGNHTLGIDEGTTGVRAVLIDEALSIKGQAYSEVRVNFPNAGWIEHDAEALWQATRRVIEGAISSAGLRPDDIAAIGITNQRGSAVLFDERGRPLGPVIGWQDQRTADRCAELLADGLFVIPNTAASKYEWLLREHAAGGQKVRLGTIDTYLANRLSGGAVHASDHSNYSVSGVYDLFAGTLDENTTEALGIDPSFLPEIVDSSGVLGETDPSIFGARVPLASLSGDQHAAMYAQGAHAEGAIELELGTSGMVKRNEGQGLGEMPTGSYPLVLWSLDGSRTFCVESPVVTAGAAAGWLRDGLGIVSDIAEVESLARSVEDSEGVWVVPAFAGLGGPHLDLLARAMIGGLSRGSNQAHIARALLEGVAWRSAEAALSLRGGAPLERLRVAGGAAQNSLLLQMIADASGAVVERPAVLERAALGAAFFAMRGLGALNDEAVAEAWVAADSFAPSITEDEREAKGAAWASRIALVRAAAG